MAVEVNGEKGSGRGTHAEILVPERSMTQVDTDGGLGPQKPRRLWKKHVGHSGVSGDRRPEARWNLQVGIA